MIPEQATQPILSLREHATALEALLAVCLADPTPRAVHKLRTETRRVEALLKLLDMMRGLPSHRAEAAKLRRHTRKLRRAAGKVRDLDVEREHIDKQAPLIEPDAASPKRAKKLADDLESMRERRGRKRKHLAGKLVKQVKQRQEGVATDLERLFNTLKDVREAKLGVTDLLAMVEHSFLRTHAVTIRTPSFEHLHSIRKAAKTARYMAELAPESPVAKRAAKRYERVQEAGGTWHDWMVLAGAAADELGDRHIVAAHFADLRDAALETYMQSLAELRGK